MSNSTNLRTKILIIFVIILISIFLSACISWILVQIFARTPENILNFNLFDVFKELFINIYDLQIFVLLLVIFSFFLIFSVLKMFNLNNFLSKTYKVTPQIEIPLPVGRHQTQQGSAWWLSQKELDKKFGKFTFDPSQPEFDHILDYARKNRKKEEEKIEIMENERKYEGEIKNLNEDFEKTVNQYNECFFVDNDIYYRLENEED